MKYVFMVLIGFMFFGCGATFKEVTVPIDNASLSTEKATVIIYQSETAFDWEAQMIYEIMVDKKSMGTLTTKKALKFSLDPGFHTLHQKQSGFIDREVKQQFIAGKTYFFRLWLEHGMWATSIWLKPTSSIDSYKAKVVVASQQEIAHTSEMQEPSNSLKKFKGKMKATNSKCFQKGEIEITIDNSEFYGHIYFQRGGKTIKPRLYGTISDGILIGRTAKLKFQGISQNGTIKGSYYNKACKGKFEAKFTTK